MTHFLIAIWLHTLAAPFMPRLVAAASGAAAFMAIGVERFRSRSKLGWFVCGSVIVFGGVCCVSILINLIG
jgi:hypothetical protein